LLALFLQLSAWGLALVTAGALGLLTRAENSTRRVAFVLAASVAVCSVLVVASIRAIDALESYFSTLSYANLFALGLIFVLAPSAVLFLTAWLIRGRQLRQTPSAAEVAPPQEHSL
jgi:cytochrome bd-type quinol oxidase subunit 2